MPFNTIQEYKWWNVLHYTIYITPDYNAKFISGTNKIQFIALQNGNVMRIELQPPMAITAITWHNTSVQFTKDKEVYLITFPQSIKKGKQKLLPFTLKGIHTKR